MIPIQWKETQAFSTSVPTRFGSIVVVWQGEEAPILSRIYLPRNDGAFDSQAHTDFPILEQWNDRRLLPDLISRATEAICAAAESKPAQFPFKLLRPGLQYLNSFRQTILSLEASIPFGHVSTYLELAKASGKPSAFRAVASALSHNPFPLLIPCHRVIASNGSLAGYQGGLEMKRFLLEREGVPFSSSGMVNLHLARLWHFS
ncbi:methylated-DNA--[protein]-cysteine S-methyltransferase [Rectinema subterraneum]|uniref:methylated-DNA--[protein]-cysteine S-methyltransferase n=1 Tax=Rectinema subterraneum TaxID=2653714 RepID=UPI00131E34AF|nr:MGMT family protein [Rectinema subterraneum]